MLTYSIENYSYIFRNIFIKQILRRIGKHELYRNTFFRPSMCNVDRPMTALATQRRHQSVTSEDAIVEAGLGASPRASALPAHAHEHRLGHGASSLFPLTHADATSTTTSHLESHKNTFIVMPLIPTPSLDSVHRGATSHV